MNVRYLLRAIFPLAPYTKPLRLGQAVALYVALVGYVVSRLVLVLPDVLARTADQFGWEDSRFVLINAGWLVVVAVSLALVRRGHLWRAALLFMVVLLLESALYFLSSAWNAPQGWIELGAAVALAALIFEERHSRWLIAGVLLLILAGVAFHANTPSKRWADSLTLIIWLLVISGITLSIMRGARLAGRPAKISDPAQHLIEVGAQIAQELLSRQETDTALEKIATAILQHFATAYHVQIYVVESDNSERARLRAATGVIGEQLLNQEYGLDVGGLSAVGRVTLSRNELLVSDFSRDPLHQPHPLLSEAQSELALPLLSSIQVIGALDIYSNLKNGFFPADVAALRAIAIQVAVAIDSLSLYESAQRSVRENQALYQQSQTHLREIERLNYQLTGRAWTDYLRQQGGASAITLDLETGLTTHDADWTETLNEAAHNHQVLSLVNDGRRVVALPIMVRNEVIGGMEFELESDAELPDGAQELIASVGQRLGMALENRRLFDETQRIAQREALINDIGTDLQSVTGVEAILQRTAHHLQEALSAHQVTIRLGSPPPVERKGRTSQEKART